MTKDLGRKQLSLAASKKNYEVQVRESVKGDEVRVLSAGKVVATGLLELDASRKNYKSASVAAMLAKINASKQRARQYDRRSLNSESDRGRAIELSPEDLRLLLQVAAKGIAVYPKDDTADRYVNSGNGTWVSELYKDRTVTTDQLVDILTNKPVFVDSPKLDAACSDTKTNAGCHSRKKLNSADENPEDGDLDVPEEEADFQQDDAEFVEDVESIVTDEDGNEVVVDDMLIVQNPDTNEISIFIPTEDDDQVPEDVEVIGEVTAATDDEVLDSSRRLVANRKQKKLKASKKVKKLNSATRISTSPLSPQEEDEIKKIFDKNEVGVDSSHDDVSEDDGIAYHEYVIKSDNTNSLHLGYLEDDLKMLEQEKGIGYWAEENENGFYAKDYHFFHYPAE